MAVNVAAKEPPTLAIVLRPQVLEFLILGAIAVLAVADIALAIAHDRPFGAVVDTLVLVASCAAALWLWPWLGLIGAAAAPTLSTLLGEHPTSTWPAAAFVVCLVSLRGISALAAGLIAGVANIGAMYLYSGTLGGGIPAVVFAPLMFAFVGSTALEQRKRWVAAAQQMDELRRAREAAVTQRITLERVRIARDLHDLVGHEIALVSMNLGAAEMHLPDGADDARSYLAAARRSTQEVLKETQRILAVLRAGPRSDLVPAANYGQLDTVVRSFSDAGLEIMATVDPPPSDLAPQVGTAVYRIVQEALTNAQRHGTGKVNLTVTAANGQVVVTSTNPVTTRGNGNGNEMTADEDTGFGLIGMRERAASVDGTITATETAGIFTVRAVLPMGGAA